jgi:hypothetical protein
MKHERGNKVLVGSFQVKRPLQRLNVIVEDNIKMNLVRVDCEE